MGVLVSVPVVKVGIVGMAMHEGRMAMPMRMQVAGRIGRCVHMLVMSVVPVPMLVLQRFMDVLVFVLLGQVQPQAEPHQAAGDDELHRYRLTQHHDREDSTHEWREREVGSSARRAQIAQSQDEQCQTHAIAEKADDTDSSQGAGRG